MRYTALILLIILFSFSISAQTPKTDITENNNSETKTEIKTEDANPISPDERAELEKAIALPNAAERISALRKFITAHPESREKTRALELIVGARAEIAAEKLRLSETEEGVKLFKLAVKEAPTPVSDKLFSGVLLQIPTNVFLRGERGAAFDIAELIEQKIGDNPKQILGLATFYLGIEYAAAARKLAEKAIALDSASAPAFQTLGLAYRIGFNLPKAEESYTKALELDPNSIVSKRSLAEMKRASGKTKEAAKLYREILEKDASDLTAKTGLILSLFDSGSRTEAEKLMAAEIAANDKNVPLLVGAAYWYATQNNGEKAVELATQALKVEPRYTWGYIALARGFMKQNNPLAAESALLTARQFGDFPTISYELALAQNAAGFYKEAAEELKKTFTIEDGKVVASLGGRVAAEGDNFVELLSLERKAGIFEPNAANDLATAEKLKALLQFENKLNAAAVDEFELSEAAEDFARGEDGMKTHRSLYVANQLLEKKKALPKALELTQNAVGGVEAAIKVSSPSSAVLAEELYEARNLAKTKGQNVIVPEIPPATLSKIIRGRIEETAGWALFEQGKYQESLDKLNLSASILPKDSVWWRSVLWKRGQVLTAVEKREEALDSYLKSYASEIANSEPGVGKKLVVEALYKELNGSLDGLEEKLTTAPKPAANTSSVFTKKSEANESTGSSNKPKKNIPKIVPIAEPTNKSVVKSEVNKSIQSETVLDKTIENPVDSSMNPANTEILVKPPTVSNDVLNKKENSENPETSSTNSETNVVTKTAENPETVPTPVPTVDIVTNPELPPAVTSAESTDLKKSVIVTDNLEKNAPVNETQNSLFPPIIITPKSERKISKKPVEKTENTSSIKNTPANQEITNESNTTENSESTEQTKTPEKKSAANSSLIDSGAGRPRVIVEEMPTTEPAVTSNCEITVSQKVVSIIRDGGSIGILISLKDGSDVGKTTYSSSSPADIQIGYEPEVGGITGQGFFLIKSISDKKGKFTATFNTPCGAKEILVKVR